MGALCRDYGGRIKSGSKNRNTQESSVATPNRKGKNIQKWIGDPLSILSPLAKLRIVSPEREEGETPGGPVEKKVKYKVELISEDQEINDQETDIREVKNDTMSQDVDVEVQGRGEEKNKVEEDNENQGNPGQDDQNDTLNPDPRDEEKQRLVEEYQARAEKRRQQEAELLRRLQEKTRRQEEERRKQEKQQEMAARSRLEIEQKRQTIEKKRQSLARRRFKKQGTKLKQRDVVPQKPGDANKKHSDLFTDVGSAHSSSSSPH
ncbi:hypothetical protein ABW20_dc0106236 [Dactylellina cionopaga]|nr:hypothetical protein ABW20_dc0106236 [Dactylellina cionopaga]